MASPSKAARKRASKKAAAKARRRDSLPLQDVPPDVPQLKLQQGPASNLGAAWDLPVNASAVQQQAPQAVAPELPPAQCRLATLRPCTALAQQQQLLQQQALTDCRLLLLATGASAQSQRQSCGIW